MAHHHHHPHPQLTAHSTLVPGQLNHIPLGLQGAATPTPSYLHLLPGPGAGFHSPSPCNLGDDFLSNQILRSTSILHQDGGGGGGGGGLRISGGCVICFGSLPPRISRGVCNSSQLFTNCCRLLEVPLGEIQHEWDFEGGDKLPFCMACTKAIQLLVSLSNQLEVIKKKLSDGIEDIHRKIYQSEDRVHGADLRTVNFRYKVLGTTILSAAPSIQEPSLKSQSDDESSVEIGDISDFNFILDPIGVLDQPVTDLEFSQLPSQSTSSEFELPSQKEPFRDLLILPHSSTPAETADVKPEARNFKNGDPTQTSRALSKGQGRQNLEHFSPFLTDSTGQLTFEGIRVTLTPSGYLCGSCGTTIGKGTDKASIRKLKIHIKGVHLGAYQCPICSKTLTTHDILLQHTSRFHNQEDIPCDICGKPLRQRNLPHHKFTHMSPEEKQLFITSTGFRPPPSKPEPKLMCNICGKMFKNQFHLKRHHASHLDKDLRKDHKCDMCDKSYTTYQYLKEHQTLYHSSEPTSGTSSGPGRRSMCKHCGRVMFHRYLKKHLLSHIPKEDRPFLCKTCGKRVANSKILKQHESSHPPKDTPEMYKSECDICGQRFLTPKKMIRHRNKTHQNHPKLKNPSKK